MTFDPKNTKSACAVALCLGLTRCVAATPLWWAVVYRVMARSRFGRWILPCRVQQIGPSRILTAALSLKKAMRLRNFQRRHRFSRMRPLHFY